MKKILPYLTALTYLLFGQVERAIAQTEDFGTDVLNGLSTATGSRDLFDIIVGIVNTALYFLGGIAILLGLYAGWLWFSSRGDKDKIDKAKKIMISAVIGLAIIFASYAITNFVIGNLYNNVLGPTNNTNDIGDGGDGDPAVVACPPPLSAGEMSICNVRPTAKAVGGYITISGWNFGPYVDAATSKVSIGGTAASLVSCGSSPYWRQKFTRDANIYYQVKVIVPNIAEGTYPILVENGAPNDTLAGFTVLAGSSGPSIACITPEEGPRGTNVVATGINFGTSGTRTINMTGWSGTAAAQINVPYSDWTDTEIRFAIPDNALASNINITNDTFALDPTDSEYFKVTCDSSCTSVCCSRNECRPANICSGAVASGPHIDSISPDNAQELSLVTIHGSGFGSTMGSGHVEFVDNATLVETRALLPNAPTVNPACQNLWTDTDIIVAVPTGLSLTAAYSVKVYPNGASVPSNAVAFDVNNVARPGICAASPGAGSLNSVVSITGVNFIDATGNTVKYGGIVGYNTTINETTDTATSNVPNLRSGLVGIQLNAGANLSNPYPFNINEAIAGDPNIVNIDPVDGPTGTYVTINGTNFGNSRGSGSVLFGTTGASFDFPLQCSSAIWSSSRIMVKVPSGLTLNDVYQLKVVRSDNKESNTKPFTFNNNPLRPGLCAIYPDNGDRNTTEVSFYGDNFGASGSQIKFYNNQTAVDGARSFHDNNSVLYIPVPNGADTGPVSVVAGTQESNALNFRVGSCSTNNNCDSSRSEICCHNSIGNYCATSCTNTRMCYYGWNFTTVPTPATPLEVVDHWPACDSTCGNAQIGVGFNVPMDPVTSQITSNYSIIDATPLASRVATETYGPVVITSAVLNETTNTVTLNYGGSLQVNHTYGVTVSQNIQSEGELEVLDSAYYWQFTVGQGSCAFTGAVVEPVDYTARRPNQNIYYQATPTAEAGSCGIQRLRCTTGTCSYNWSLSNTDVADWSVTSANGASARTAKSTSVTVPADGLSSTVSCTITQTGLSPVSATTNLRKDYRSYLESLMVTAHYPDCGNACTNAVVGMHFNSALNESTATIGNIHIFDTDNSIGEVTQSIVKEINDTANPNNESVWRIVAPLVSGHRYHVVISTAVQNAFGNSLGNNFEWYFTVGSEACSVTGATVAPASATATINQSVSYVAQTTSNTISCGNIPVNCSNCSYQWSSSDLNVATISGALNTKNTRATVASTATNNSSADISCQVNQGTNNVPSTPGVLHVNLNTPAYTIPFIESYDPAIDSIAQCRNTAIEIVFSEKMNTDSIKNSLKLYNSSNVEIAGRFSFSTIDGSDVDTLNNETKMVFSPTELLAASSQYHVSLGTGIVSARGVALNLTNPDLSAWNFVTGTEICKISYVVADPSIDWFTCGGNSCVDDRDNTTSGNQHIYSATAYSRQGTALSATGLSYAWQVSPNTDSVDLSGQSDNQITATAQSENGEARVSATVSGTISGVNLGSVSASILVNVFLCQNPWPSLDNFPWYESNNPGTKNLNFSTYYCAKFNDASPSLPMLSYPPVLSHNTNNLGEYLLTVDIDGSAGSAVNFIAFRVMPNTEHLSVKEWYKTQFPGDALGTIIAIDGYEAMQVGNTTYISAANIVGNDLYTNIYIVSYSVGADAQTKSIYDQLLANFQLNTNTGFTTFNDENLCTDTAADGTREICSTDFDCPSNEICLSKSLKLRRDVKRLTDLLPVKKYLSQYGSSHLACSNNSQMTCTLGASCNSSSCSQCTANAGCVAYYPTLNAGTFVPGKTNTKWPSWQQTLASDVRQSLPVDPINRFSTCGTLEGADPNTCWKETTREFQCLDTSSIYGYILQNSGQSYTLYSNFEFDPIRGAYPSFVNNLYNAPASHGVNSLGNISTTLSGYCSAAPVLPGSNLCGNGRVDASAGEACDGGINYNQCDTLGNHNWWNEQVSGCNPPGTPNQCQWYMPALTPAMCGGYCGDGSLQTHYESCDAGRFNGHFSCPAGAAASCNASSCNAVCADGLPAARCGDGVWTAGREACDPTGNPNGLSGWDCPNNGNVMCSANSCGISCDNGQTPYQGRCGDGTVQSPEACDYASYSTPLPSLSTASHAYTCSIACNFNNPAQPYCGDGIIQYGFRELCDTNLLAPVRPAQSSEFNQYACRMADDANLTAHPLYTRCTPTIGGYCGDNIRQSTNGELCDGPDYPGRPIATNSSPTNTYTCADTCISSDPAGGYCGDAIIQPAYEICDAGAVAQKKVELVFVFDVSKSMDNAADQLCLALDNIIGNASSFPGINYKMTVMVMGDNDNKLSSGTDDDIATLAPDATRLPEHIAVFNKLVSNCTTYRDHNNLSDYDNPGNYLRYVSFYDENGNDIDGDVNVLNDTDDNVTLNGCGDQTSISPGGPLENWGYATKKIIESYDWQDGYARIIMPVSDEYAWCGGDVSSASSLKSNENNTIESGREDILVDIIEAATDTTSRPVTHISPVILRYSGQAGEATTINDGQANQQLAEVVANQTGGIFSNTYFNWTDGITRVINAAFCDGNNDGKMDCTLPGTYLPPPDNTPPSNPSNLVATPGDRQVALTWNAAVDTASPVSYVVERSTSATSGFSALGTFGTTYHTDTSGLTNGTTYYYRVRAQDASGNVSALYAGPVSAIPVLIDTQAPMVPANLTATPGDAQVALTWSISTDPESSAVTYVLERATAAAGPWATTATIGATTHTDTGLNNGTTYYYRVKARDTNNNQSNYSTTVSATPMQPDTQAPSAITDLVATPSGVRVFLAWTAPADNVGVTSYNILRSNTSGSGYSLVATSNTAAYTNTSVPPGIYYYVVTAQDAVGNISANSNEAMAKTDTQAPPVPTGLSASPANQQVTITWNASIDPEGSAVTYTLERATVVTGPWTAVTTISATSHTDTGLTNGTTYYYRVRATDSSNNSSAYTSSVSAIPDNNTVAPNQPTALSVVANAVLGVMNLNWTMSAPGPMVAYYLIERSLTADFSNPITVGATLVNSFVDYFTDGPPQVAVNYYYRVKAVGTLLLESVYSNIDSDIFPDTQAPSVPAGVSGVFSPTQIALTWTASTDNVGVTQYIIERSDTSPTSGFVQIGTATASSYTDSSVALNTTYYYHVAARDTAGNQSAFSAPATVITRDTIPPSAPTITAILVSPSMGHDIIWTWSSDNVAVDHYIIERSDNGPTGTYVQKGTATINTYNDVSTAVNSTYYYQVKAADLAGNISVPSAPYMLMTIDNERPSTPTGFTATAVNPGPTINLTWNAATDNRGIKGYYIERSTSASGPFARIPSPTSLITTTSYIDSTTVTGSYYYRLVAVDTSDITSSPYVNTSTAVCDIAYCNQWDADLAINRILCGNSCTSASHCCQVCDNGSGAYMGCRVNTVPASCSVYTTAGTCR